MNGSIFTFYKYVGCKLAQQSKFAYNNEYKFLTRFGIEYLGKFKCITTMYCVHGYGSCSISRRCEFVMDERAMLHAGNPAPQHAACMCRWCRCYIGAVCCSIMLLVTVLPMLYHICTYYKSMPVSSLWQLHVHDSH